MNKSPDVYADNKDLVLDLVKYSSDAAFAIDGECRLVAWNDHAQRLLGYELSEVIGQYCGDILRSTLSGGEPLCHYNCDIFQCLKKCRPYGIQGCRIRHRDGQWITASISSVAMSERARRLYANNLVAIIYIRGMATESLIVDHHTLQVFSLGSFAISVAGRSIDTGKWKRKQAITLLKYLITHLDHPVHRERLLDCLWPGISEDQGWERLKVTMYYLRRELRACSIRDEVVKTIDKSYLLRRDAVWVDAADFERLAGEGQAFQKRSQWSDALKRYTAARELYRGDYLEEEPYADWCAEERERLREIYLDLLARAAECHAELGQYTEAEQICRKALVFDPCREHFHYELMRYIVKNGRPDLALAQYHHCRAVLAREFGVEPLPQTQRFYEQIRKGDITARKIGRGGG